MFGSIVILIISTALFFFYLQATCQKVLRRQFSRPYFQSVVNAYRLEFLSLPAGAQADPASVRAILQGDLLTLTCLMNQGYSHGERLLLLYFWLVYFSLEIRQKAGLRQQAAISELASILQYFSNVVGEQAAARTPVRSEAVS